VPAAATESAIPGATCFIVMTASLCSLPWCRSCGIGGSHAPETSSNFLVSLCAAPCRAVPALVAPRGQGKGNVPGEPPRAIVIAQWEGTVAHEALRAAR
jgi:hypothetical protein